LERPGPDRIAERLGVESAVDPDQAADAEKREPEPELNGSELGGNDDHEREAVPPVGKHRLDQTERLHADAIDRELHRARVAPVTEIQEAAARDGPRVDRNAVAARSADSDGKIEG